uniref:SD27884p n=1 Tax=Drosophila melanogaster TaxID=7227 RepID=Q8MRT0_DROME|nr:SD27884p [Drosophila melanogaster]
MLAQKSVAGADELAQAKGKCVHCANAAERVCQRCGDFYCSKHCQRQDWLRHRYICIPLPALVSPNEYSVFQSDRESTLEGACSLNADKSVVEASPIPLSRSPILPDLQCNNAGRSSIIAAKDDIPVSPPKAIIPPSGAMVYITDFISSNRCYIRDASESAERAFDEVCKKVNTIATLLPRIKNPPPNRLCLVHFNGMYVRAKMCKKLREVSHLFLVDLGIKHSGPFFDFKDINDELKALPCSSQLVQLKNVLNCDYSNDVIAFNSKFVGKKYMATIKKCPGLHLVELVNTEMNFSVNEQLNAFFNSKKLLRNPNSAAENIKSCSLEGPQPSHIDQPIAIPAIECKKMLTKPEVQNECEEILKQQNSGQIDQSKSTNVLVTEGASNKMLGFIDLADKATKTDQDTAPKPKDEDVKHSLTQCLTPKANYPLQLPNHKKNLELPVIHKTNAQTNGIVMSKNEHVLKPVS